MRTLFCTFSLWITGLLFGATSLLYAADESVVSSEPKSARNNSPLTLTQTSSTITLSQGQTPILVYNLESPPVPEGMNPLYHRSGFLHPVSSPSGSVVTAAFPYDHPHQHGIFSAWVKTTWNGRSIDFWNLAGGTGRVLHQRTVATFAEEDRLGFEVELVHRAEQEPVTDVLHERWKITAWKTDGTYHLFDLQSTQTALTDEPLFVHQYHYGGMALRGPVQWLSDGDRDPAPDGTVAPPEGSSFLNSAGSDRLKGNHEHARWVALTGTHQGHPVSVAMLCHSGNFRAPQAARIHPTKPYFVFAPCVDGEFVIDRTHPLQSSWRFLITDTPADPQWLDQQWEAWCGSPAASDAAP